MRLRPHVLRTGNAGLSGDVSQCVVGRAGKRAERDPVLVVQWPVHQRLRVDAHPVVLLAVCAGHRLRRRQVEADCPEGERRGRMGDARGEDDLRLGGEPRKRRGRRDIRRAGPGGWRIRRPPLSDLAWSIPGSDRRDFNWRRADGKGPGTAVEPGTRSADRRRRGFQDREEGSGNQMKRVPTRREFTAAAAAVGMGGLFASDEPTGPQAASRQDADYLVEPERRTKVRAHVDVVVCGGGPAGIGAAIAAARNGANTLLLENLGSLGGVGSNAIMNRLGPFHDQEKMIVGGIPMEILERLVALNGAIMPRPVIWTRATNNRPEYWAPFDPEILKLVLDRMTEEAGVKILFNTRVVGTVVNSGRTEGVLIESKSGREAVRAKIVIDATGDGDVAAWAGAPYEKGRPEDGWMQPVTVLYKVHNLDREKARRVLAEERAKIVGLARARGEDIPRFLTAGTDNFLRADETYYNEDQIHGADGTNVEHVTKAWLDARKMIWQEFHFAKKHVPGYENAYVALTSSLLGVRETRRILGEYVLNAEDVLSARKFPDTV